jgi:hypothetical protein
MNLLRRLRIWRAYWQLRAKMIARAAFARTDVWVQQMWLDQGHFHLLPKNHDYLTLPPKLVEQLEEHERAVGE